MNGWTFPKVRISFSTARLSPVISPSLPLPRHKDSTQELTPSPMHVHVKTHTQTKRHACTHLHVLILLLADTNIPLN